MQKIAKMLIIIILTASNLEGMQPQRVPAWEVLVAIKHSNPRSLERLISEGADVNVKASDGDTALMWAVLAIKIAYERVQTPMPTDKEMEQQGKTFLAVQNEQEMAARYYTNALAVLDLLLQAGARKDTKNPAGKTAFDYAVQFHLTQEILDKLRP